MTGGGDPRALFRDFLDSPSLRAVALLDRGGLVVAGGMEGGGTAVEEVATHLGGTIEEAVRTAEYLHLGPWRGILLEMVDGVAYLRPVGDALLLVAGESGAPVGWLRRVADEAAARCREFLQGGDR